MKPINIYAVIVALVGSVLLSGCGGSSAGVSASSSTHPPIDTPIPTPDAILGG